MPAQVFMPLVPQPSADWQFSYDHAQHSMMPLQDVMNPLPPTPRHHPPPPPQQQHSPYMTHHTHQQPPPPQQAQQPQQPRQWHDQPPTPTLQQIPSGPWSAQDDDILVKARTMNLPWQTIHANHFPNKTANACRKRYERLVQKRRGTDWDEDRTARLAVAYKEMREQTWSPLAEQLGERWDHVEKACMEKGLRNILNLASSHARASSKRHSKIDAGSENGQYVADRAEREDSGIAFAGDSSSRRSSRSNGGAIPTWQQQILQPPRHH